MTLVSNYSLWKVNSEEQKYLSLVSKKKKIGDDKNQYLLDNTRRR